MKIWKPSISGSNVFLHGKERHEIAGRAGCMCGLFVLDDEDETVSDESPSCYNCRYRRWTADSFECVKAQAINGIQD